jgi:hypothetical protein
MHRPAVYCIQAAFGELGRGPKLRAGCEIARENFQSNIYMELGPSEEALPKFGLRKAAIHSIKSRAAISCASRLSVIVEIREQISLSLKKIFFKNFQIFDKLQNFMYNIYVRRRES